MGKIVFIIWRNQPGGLEVVLKHLLSELQDYSKEVFVLRQNQSQQEFIDSSMVTLSYGGKTYFQILLGLVKLTLRNRNSIFHVFNAGPFILLWIKVLGVRKIVYHVHGSIYWKTSAQKFFRKFFWRIALFSENRFICNSSYSKLKFEQNINQFVDISVIYNPFNTESFQAKPKIPKAKLNIMYLGRLEPGKNLFQWLDIAAALLQEDLDLQFNIYGSGVLSHELEHYARQLGIADSVNFEGFIDDVSKAYYENDLLLFLSEYESFGNVVIESILCGTPVLVSYIPAMLEIFEEFPEFILPEGSISSVDIYDALKNIQNLQTLTLKARSHFIKRFGQQNFISRISQVYSVYA